MFHDAPHLTLRDPALLGRFCSRYGINPALEKESLIVQVANAFSRVPYENLTKIIKADAVVSAASAMRHPDEFIRDHLELGTGGTCFSLTAATIGVYNALGIEAHPVLADRHYGPDTHCGLLIASAQGMLLLDPGYLLFRPMPVPNGLPVSVDMGDNTVELVPQPGTLRVDLWTSVKGSRKQRLTYKIRPVDPVAFGRAWEQSFAWEMMTYPVLTRRAYGEHIYLQGNTLRVRGQGKNIRSELTPAMMGDFAHNALGINRDIVARALEIISHGTSTPTAAG